MRIGAHVSTAGKVYYAFDRASELEIKDIQIFPWSPRMWGPFRYSEEDIAAFKKRRVRDRIATVVFHNVYLINIAGANFIEKSQRSFEETIKLAETMGVDATIVHLGHSADREAGLGRVIKSVFSAVKYCDNSEIWLETTAGTRNAVGATFKDLGKILRVVDSKKVNIIIDTCHIWAAGYDIKSKKGYEETMAELEGEIGPAHVKAFHLNDSKGFLGSGLDRHEHIGQGELGKEAFRRLLNDDRFRHLPAYLETPRDSADNKYDPVAEDIKLLRKLQKK